MITSLNVAFRVDASKIMGIGHFMRCFALAEALKKAGANTRFVCEHLPASLEKFLMDYNHEISFLKYNNNERSNVNTCPDFLDENQERDAIDTSMALSDRRWDWLVIDHYGLDNRYESIMRNSITNILVIDDMADRIHDCDVLLDQNFYFNMEERYVDKIPKQCRLLLGPTYALLRDEFKQLRLTVKPRADVFKKILVFFGWGDPENLTTQVIEGLKGIKTHDLHIDVIIGDEHPNRIEIEKTCKKYNYTCHIQTKRMAELMASSDLALGAGGSASWERCCLGLPTICFSFADNQVEIASALDRIGACIYLGNNRPITKKNIRRTLTEIISDTNRLSVMSEKAYALVDGCGAERVCELIKEYK